MAEAFGTAIYTNCRPGQGLDGIAGMQFQSRSPGVGPEALAVVRKHLLYEPPQLLMRQQRPVDEYPPSFAHIHDGVLATAAGVYIGREAVGSREGNHLTHAILTSDPRSYRSVRPAQMFGASFWSTEAAPTTRNDPLPPTWRPGPIDAGVAASFVTSHRHGADTLAALLTVLAHADGSERRRVLLIADDAEAVLRWLVAATLLLPQPRALEIGFKVFTADPARSALPVVAVHPDWGSHAATVDNDLGYAVFDLIRHRWSQVPVTPDAREWADLFCREDPFDVSEAVDVVEASGLDGSTARGLALAATLRRTPPPTQAAALVDWLRSGPAVLREAYGGTVIDALADCPDVEVLRRLDDTVSPDGLAGRGDVVRLRLLRAELNQVLTDPATAPVTGGAASRGTKRVSVAAADDATDLVVDVLGQARGSAFDAVLRTAARYDVRVPLERVSDAVTAFVSYWADAPEARYDAAAWTTDQSIPDLLLAELRRRAEHSPAVANVIGRSWWKALLPGMSVVNLESPLERAVLSAAMAHSDPIQRLELVQRNLDRELGDKEYRTLTGILWAGTVPLADELRILCSHKRSASAVDPDVLTAFVKRVRTGDPLSPADLDVCTELADRKLIKLDDATNKILAHQRWFMDVLAGTTGFGDVPTEQVVERLRAIPAGLLNAHAEPLARRLSTIEDLALLPDLLHIAPPPVLVRYLRLVTPASWQAWPPAQVAVAFYLCRGLSREPPYVNALGTQIQPLDEELAQWVDRASQIDVDAVARHLGPLGPEWVDGWRKEKRINRGRLWPLRRPRDG